MKVCKFGGSSLASASQVQKVMAILESDPARRVVVVSAPGKRSGQDFKITDRLIALANAIQSNYSGEELIESIVERYTEIAQGLELDEDFGTTVRGDLRSRIETYQDEPQALVDALKAAGEDLNSQLFAKILTKHGHTACALSPAKIGLMLESTPAGVKLLPESYEQIRESIEEALSYYQYVIVPGFFGVTKDTGRPITFSRGGSDITGSIVASALNAELYENWTDVDAVYAISPSLRKDAKPICELTYYEMRELAYAGFSILHEEALAPLMRNDIPLKIQNTNNPQAKGTVILPRRTDYESIVTGVAGSPGFVAIHVARYLMNQEISFVQKLLAIFARYNVPIEHLPTGIDSITIIIREDVFPIEKENHIIDAIWKELKPDQVTIDRELAIVMIVGDAMAQTVGVAARATNALSRAGINIKLLIQESSEISIIFGVENRFCTYAILELYRAFFD